MNPLFSASNETIREYSINTQSKKDVSNNHRLNYQEEFVLTYSVGHAGSRFTEDTISQFEFYNLVLIESNTFQNLQGRDVCTPKNTTTIFFDKDFLELDFVDSPDAEGMKTLFAQALQGVQILGPNAKTIGKKVVQITKESGWKRFILLIEVLFYMSEAEDYRLFEKQNIPKLQEIYSDKRIKALYNCIIHNYYKNITLQDAAKLSNMNKVAFCRYLKKATSKTFSQILNEIRISIACKQLVNTEDSISSIAYNCGYLSVAYFNRKFKSIKNINPGDYRKKRRDLILSKT